MAFSDGRYYQSGEAVAIDTVIDAQCASLGGWHGHSLVAAATAVA
jgi:hypothetical protein